jgi:hypothetical protein
VVWERIGLSRDVVRPPRRSDSSVPAKDRREESHRDGRDEEDDG